MERKTVEKTDSINQERTDILFYDSSSKVNTKMLNEQLNPLLRRNVTLRVREQRDGVVWRGEMGRYFHMSAPKFYKGSNGREILLLMKSFNSEKRGAGEMNCFLVL